MYDAPSVWVVIGVSRTYVASLAVAATVLSLPRCAAVNVPVAIVVHGPVAVGAASTV